MDHGRRGIAARLIAPRDMLDWGWRRLPVACGLMLLACRPAAPTATAPMPTTPELTSSTAPFDPRAVSDAAFTEQECVALGTMRATDPAQTRSAIAYTQECIETTKTDPPWLRRTARCVLLAPGPADRKRCFDQQLVREREAATQRLEAQIKAQAERERAEQLQRAEQILREAREEEGAQPGAADNQPHNDQ